jgi:hypothetical protein
MPVTGAPVHLRQDRQRTGCGMNPLAWAAFVVIGVPVGLLLWMLAINLWVSIIRGRP